MPSKKGKEAIDAKKKGPMPPPKEKKKALPKFKSTPSQMASKVVVHAAVPGMYLGPNASVLETPLVAEKLLQRFVLPADQVELDKLDLNWAITNFFHVVSHVHRSLN